MPDEPISRTPTVAEQELQQVLDERYAPLPGDEGHFAIRTPDAAEWALRNIARLQAEQRARQEAAQRQRDAIDEWLRRTGEAVDHECAFFSSLLEAYIRAKNQAHPTVKSIPLPSGTLQLRHEGPKWRYPEADAPLRQLLDYARRAGCIRAVVRVDGLAVAAAEQTLRDAGLAHTCEESVDKPALKKRGTVRADGSVVDRLTGEIVPGVVVEPEAPPTFSIKLAEVPNETS